MSHKTVRKRWKAVASLVWQHRLWLSLWYSSQREQKMDLPQLTLVFWVFCFSHGLPSAPPPITHVLLFRVEDWWWAVPNSGSLSLSCMHSGAEEETGIYTNRNHLQLCRFFLTVNATLAFISWAPTWCREPYQAFCRRLLSWSLQSTLAFLTINCARFIQQYTELVSGKTGRVCGNLSIWRPGMALLIISSPRMSSCCREDAVQLCTLWKELALRAA